MTSSRTGRLATLVAAPLTTLALAAGTLLVAPVAPAAAAEPNDSARALEGGSWLTSQLRGATVYNDQFDFVDYGLTLDLGFALDAFDGSRYDATLRRMTRAVGTPAAVRAYTTGRGFGDARSRYAGATAKLASFVQQRGGDATAVGGTDLVAALEGLVSQTPRTAGRLEDRSEFGDNANVIGQAFAALALSEAGSDDAAGVTGFLLQQQCEEGYFRASFTPRKSAADQSCDGGTAEESRADVDATALALVQLQATEPVLGSPAATAVADGVGWLLDAQATNGSYAAAAPAAAVANANSTGLAAQALAAAGEDQAATAAARWLSGLQASACDGRLARQGGAVAYDRPAYRLGTRQGITTASRDQWRRASAQAVPALRSLGEGVGADARLAGPAARYVRAGSEARLRVRGLGESDRLCIAGPTGGTDVAGSGFYRVRVPAGTGARTYRLEGTTARVTLDALAGKQLAVRLAKRAVARGGSQTVTVRGLASRERVTVRLRGRVVDTGVATRGGFFRSTVRVTGPTGRAPVQVTGQFGNRTGTTPFQVR